MLVDVYIVTDPAIPGRAFVSAWPPTIERLRAMRAQGCTVHHAVVVVPDPVVDQIPVSATATRELRYLGRTVRASGRVLLGTVTRETDTEVAVTWADGSVGTFYSFETALAESRLILEDTDDQQETAASPANP